MVGGFDFRDSKPFKDYTQLVNLNPAGNDCSSLARYPNSMHGGVGGLLNHQLVICGKDKDCYRYDIKAQDWTKFATLKIHLHGSWDGAATMMSDGSLWLTGKLYQFMTFTTGSFC